MNTPAVHPDHEPRSEHERVIIDALRTVLDPEIPVNIFDLGLIYDIVIDKGHVLITMTLTSPGCPVAGAIVENVRAVVAAIPDTASSTVELVWEPTWTVQRMSEVARLELDYIGIDPTRPRGGGAASLTVGKTPGSRIGRRPGEPRQ
jgi:FeS assembly SUF system protein